ncbi:MAG: ATPase [Hyphomicrobiales bacterium]|nr:ATPase [Hyphomicrobiales bacterium]
MGEGEADSVKRPERPERPRRFYEAVTVEPCEEGLVVLLDGRELRTPARNRVAVSDPRIAEALAREWEAQETFIEPGRMPLSRLVNTAIDRVSTEIEAVRSDIVRHAGSDLILYRADGPPDLVDAEKGAWDPLLGWAGEALGVHLQAREGIVHAAQDQAALDAFAQHLVGFDALGLTALHTVTTLTGSAVIALAVARRRLLAADAWEAAHVDEEWQMQRWGRDEMALETRATRWLEMAAAALVLAPESDGTATLSPPRGEDSAASGKAG